MPGASFSWSDLYKGNPITSTYTAGKDLLAGNYKKAGQDMFDPNNRVAGITTPSKTDTSQVDAAKAQADAAAAQFAKDRAALLPPPTGAAAGVGYAGGAHGTDPRGTTGTAIQVDPTYIDPLRQKQAEAISLVRDAALGNVPSAAELQARRMATQAAAQQFGIASALQGGMSTGGALRQASQGAAQVEGDATAQGAILRAKEQADARAQLVSALAGLRDEETGLSTTNANLTIDQQKMLLMAQLQEQGFSTELAKAIVDASAKNAAGENQLKSGIIGSGIGLISKSDRTAKRDVKPANLVKLAKSIPGYTYRYKDEGDGPGKRVGVMAQDVQKGGPVGKGMVRMGPGKHLHLDVGNAVGAALAMSAEALRRSA